MMFPDFFYVDWLIFIEFKRVFFFHFGLFIIKFGQILFREDTKNQTTDQA